MTYLWPTNFEVFGNLTGSDLKLQKGGVVRIVLSKKMRKFEIMFPLRHQRHLYCAIMIKADL